MNRKHSTETPVCPQEYLVIISYTTGLSFSLERIGPLAAIIIIILYLLILYLSALRNTPENPFASIYSESLIKTACQHRLLLVRFDTLIYRKYYDTPHILVGHQDRLRVLPFSGFGPPTCILSLHSHPAKPYMIHGGYDGPRLARCHPYGSRYPGVPPPQGAGTYQCPARVVSSASSTRILMLGSSSTPCYHVVLVLRLEGHAARGPLVFFDHAGRFYH
jgi:hypothetical protein